MAHADISGLCVPYVWPVDECHPQTWFDKNEPERKEKFGNTFEYTLPNFQ